MSATPKNPVKAVAAVAGSDTAPVILADLAYAYGTNGGIVQLELGINTLVPIDGSPKVKVRPICTGHLRMSAAAAAQLRDMLDKVLEPFDDAMRQQRAAELKTSPNGDGAARSN
jgi:hypothetical protein